MSSQGDKPLVEVLARLSTSRSDEDAWRDLYTMMWPFVMGILFRRLGGTRDLAEDASQEVFRRLVHYCQFGNFRDAGEFRRYLGRVSHNLALDHVRRALRLPEVSLNDGETRRQVFAKQDAVDLEGQTQARDLLSRLFALLDERDRCLLRLLIKNRSLREIAGQLGISYGNTAVRVFRLRQKLRNHFAATSL
jgi:RNA polymerase sigma-70 factor (ECF subfamily)